MAYIFLLSNNNNIKILKMLFYQSKYQQAKIFSIFESQNEGYKTFHS